MIKYNQKIQKLDELFDKVSSKQKPLVYIDLCKALIETQQKGEITIAEAAQKMMRGNYYNELLAIGKLTPQNEITDHIIELAGYLEEIPYYPEERDKDEDWKLLIELVEKFRPD